jgi:hypothetical protein
VSSAFLMAVAWAVVCWSMVCGAVRWLLCALGWCALCLGLRSVGGWLIGDGRILGRLAVTSGVPVELPYWRGCSQWLSPPDWSGKYIPPGSGHH